MTISGECGICNSLATGCNIFGNFCNKHKDLYVRSWAEQSFYDFMLEKQDDYTVEELKAFYLKFINQAITSYPSYIPIFKRTK